MAKFESVPVKQNARTRVLRNARKGTRPALPSPDYGDALETLTSLQRLREAYLLEAQTNSFLSALKAAWGARKSDAYPTP